jgi:hypothetical protein
VEAVNSSWLYEKSVTWCNGMMMLSGGEVSLGRGMEGDDARWTDVILEKKHVNDSAVTNRR